MSKSRVTNFRGECFHSPLDNMHIKEEPKTPTEDDFGDPNLMEMSFESGQGSMRKSLSMNDISALRKKLVKLEFSTKDDMYERHSKPFCGSKEFSKTNFVSMAEAIYHYQRDTPGRFHSSKPTLFKAQVSSSRPELTRPQSPMLRSRTRVRNTHIMSQEEKEELEFEEIKKHKIKANPVPKSVIEGPIHLPDVNKKPITIPQPFNLTELQKKPALSPDHTQTFKARPAPKHIYEKPHIPVKPPVQTTKPTSPNFHYKKGKIADQVKFKNERIPYAPATQKPDKICEKPKRQGPLKPEPFSFEKRDEEQKRRKEEWIKRQIEEEKKQASQFKAHPLPGIVRKHMQKVSSRGSSTSSENKENHVKFEARPATVLYKEPFKPVFQQLQPVKPAPFDLTTQKRAADRERFDQLLKEKEQEQDRLRLQREKEQQEAEEKLKAELRAKLVHHAKPAPVPSPFVPEKSVAPLTVPETPKFIRRLNKK